MSDLDRLLARLVNPPEDLPPDHLWPEGLHNEAAVALTHLRQKVKDLTGALTAAQDLYDNRLGHRDDNPQWSAPQQFWRRLGDTLAKVGK